MPDLNDLSAPEGSESVPPVEMMPQTNTSPGSTSLPDEGAQETERNLPLPGIEQPRGTLIQFRAQPRVQEPPQTQIQAAIPIPRAAPRIAPHERNRALAGLALIRARWLDHFRSDQLSVEDWAARLVLAVVNAVMGLSAKPEVASVIRAIKDTPRVVAFRNNDFQILLWVSQVRERLVEVIRAMGGSEETILQGNPYP